MILIGDYFSLLMISILCLFYFGNKYYSTTAGKYFAWCLILTGMTALTDIFAVAMMNVPTTPPAVNLALNSLYFLINILTTSFFALVLFAKILEHVHDDFCMKRAKFALTIVFAVYSLIVLLNIFTGWLFSFDEAGNYIRGPLNAAGYMITICQMGLVLMCFFRNQAIAV